MFSNFPVLCLLSFINRDTSKTIGRQHREVCVVVYAVPLSCPPSVVPYLPTVCTSPPPLWGLPGSPHGDSHLQWSCGSFCVLWVCLDCCSSPHQYPLYRSAQIQKEPTSHMSINHWSQHDSPRRRWVAKERWADEDEDDKQFSYNISCYLFNAGVRQPNAGHLFLLFITTGYLLHFSGWSGAKKKEERTLNIELGKLMNELVYSQQQSDTLAQQYIYHSSMSCVSIWQHYCISSRCSYWVYPLYCEWRQTILYLNVFFHITLPFKVRLCNF